MATYSSPYYYSSFQPAEVSYFTGEGVDQWLYQIEGFFNKYMTAPEQKFVVAVPYLSGEAMEWYRQMWLARRLNTWENFVIDLRHRFKPPETQKSRAELLDSLWSMCEELKQTLTDMKTQNSVYMENFSKIKSHVSSISTSDFSIDKVEESDDAAQTELITTDLCVPVESNLVSNNTANEAIFVEDIVEDSGALILDVSVGLISGSSRTWGASKSISMDTTSIHSGLCSFRFELSKDVVGQFYSNKSFETQLCAIKSTTNLCLSVVCENASVNLSTMADAMLVKPPAKPPDSLKSASKFVIMNYIIDKSLIYERILVIARVPKEWDKSFQDVKKMRNREVFYGRHFYNVMIDSYGKYKYLDHALTAVNIMRSKEESNFLPKLMLFGDLSFCVSIFDLAALCKCDGNVEMIKSTYDPLIRNTGMALVIMSNGQKVEVATEFLGQDGCEMQGERLTLDKPPPLPPDIILTHPLWRCGKVKEWMDMTIYWDVKGFYKGCFKKNLATILDYIWFIEDGVVVQGYGTQRCENDQCIRVSLVITPYKHIILHALCEVLVTERPESELFSPIGSERAITNWILRFPEVPFIDFSSLFVSRISDVVRGIAELGFGTPNSNGKGPGLDAFIVFIGSAFNMNYGDHLKLLRFGMSSNIFFILSAKPPDFWQIVFGYHVHSVILSVVMCLKLSRSSSDLCALTNGSNEATLLISVRTSMTCASTFKLGVFEVSMKLCNCALLICTGGDFEPLVLGIDWHIPWSYNWSLVVSVTWSGKLTRKSSEDFDHCTMKSMLGLPSIILLRDIPSNFLIHGSVLIADVINMFIGILSKFSTYLHLQKVITYQLKNVAELSHFAASSKPEAEEDFINELMALVIVKKRSDDVEDGTTSEENKVSERLTTSTTATAMPHDGSAPHVAAAIQPSPISIVVSNLAQIAAKSIHVVATGSKTGAYGQATSNLIAGNHLEVGVQQTLNMNGGTGNFDFVLNRQQSQALQPMVQANMQFQQPLLQELGNENPAWMRIKQEHQVNILLIINEPVEGAEGDVLENSTPAMQQTIQVTPVQQVIRHGMIEFSLSVCWTNQFFPFSLPRPPESADLEDKVIFKGRGMLRILLCHMKKFEDLYAIC